MSVSALHTIRELPRFDEYAIGIGNKENANNISRPKDMMQYITGFFSSGRLTRNNKDDYEPAIQELRNALYRHDVNLTSLLENPKIDFQIDDLNISLQSLCKMPTEIKRLNTLEVSVCTEKKSVDKVLPDSTFTLQCASILIRDKLGLNKDNDLFTPGGEINLSDIDESKLPLNDIDEILQDVPAELKCLLPEEVQRNLNDAKSRSLINEGDNEVANHINSSGMDKVRDVAKDSAISLEDVSFHIRDELGLPRDKPLLTPDGKMNLLDIADSKIGFVKAVNILQALPAALRWCLPESIQKALNHIRDTDAGIINREGVVINAESDIILWNESARIRNKLGLPRDKPLLTPDGKINLSDIKKRNLDFNDIASVLMGMPASLRWDLSDEIQKKLNNLIDNNALKSTLPELHIKPGAEVNANGKGEGDGSLLLSQKKIPLPETYIVELKGRFNPKENTQQNKDEELSFNNQLNNQNDIVEKSDQALLNLTGSDSKDKYPYYGDSSENNLIKSGYVRGVKDINALALFKPVPANTLLATKA